MKNKFFSVILSALLLTSMPIQIYANAVEENTANTLSTENAASVYSVGLISTCTISCSGGSKTIYITASVYGTATMSKIGFKNIRIQRLVNNKWETERTAPDQIDEGVMQKNIAKHPESVEGGHYYRVVIDNYAKENTWWFPDTQTVEDTSDAVWIP